MELNFLTDDQVRILGLLIQDYRRKGRTLGGPEPGLQPPTGVLLGKPVAGQQLPATSGIQAGQAACRLYTLDPANPSTDTIKQIMNPDGSPWLETVYNPFSTAKDDTAFFPVYRTRHGVLICGGGGGGVSGGVFWVRAPVGGVPAADKDTNTPGKADCEIMLKNSLTDGLHRTGDTIEVHNFFRVRAGVNGDRRLQVSSHSDGADVVGWDMFNVNDDATIPLGGL